MINSLFTLIILIIFTFILFPLTTSHSDSVSFRFSNFKHNLIGFHGDATSSGNTIKLTKRTQNSIGHAVYLPPVHLLNNITGEIADFKTVFYFTINRSGSQLYGDGLSFFIAPLYKRIPYNSNGGLLGLVSPETAFNYTKNQFLAVEFDTFANEWDPNPVSEFPHVGINVNSIRSLKTVELKSVEPDGVMVKMIVRYDSQMKELFVIVSYPESEEIGFTVAHSIDLRNVLPEWVRIGFSAATGGFSEEHDICFWSFTSSFKRSINY